MAVKYLSNKVKDLQVGITNYSENKPKSLYVVGNVGIGTTNPTAEVGISNTSVLAVGILTAYRIYSSVYGEFTGAFSGGTVDTDSLNVTGISTLGTVKVSGGIVTATAGVVTYYGDGQYLTGIAVTEHTDTRSLNVSGLSTFGGNIDANADLDVDGHTNLDDLVVTGVATFNNTVTLSALLDCNGGADINTLTAATAKISDLTDTRIVIAGTDGELADSAQLRYVSSTLTVGTNLDVDGHTELDDVNVGGAITATTFTGALTGNVQGNLTGTVNTAAQPNITSLGTLTGLTVSGSGLQVQNAAAGIALDVTGYTELDTVSVASTSTFSGAVTADAGLTASTAKISDLTDNRIVIAGTSGELEDTTKLTFDGTTLAVVGDATFTGNVSIAGTLTKEDVTNIDSVGLVTAQTGVRITSGGLVVSSGVSTFTDAIDANGGANISGGSGLTASSIKVSSLADNNIVVSGANGELINDTQLTYNRTTNVLSLTGNLFLPNSGNHAGIGTASKLGTGTDSLSVYGDSATSGVRIWASSATNKATSVPLQVADSSGTELFRVHGDGNIGIGIANPSEKLDVSGNIKVSGDINANGNIIGDAATNISGINSVTATTFFGSGSELTDLPSGGLWVANSAGIHTTVDVGIGTTNPSDAVNPANTKKLSVGIVSAYQLYVNNVNVTGVSTFAGNINANGNIIGDNSTNITGIAGVTATTLTGTLQTAAQTNITSVGTLGALTVSGNINANGDIIGDGQTNISGISSLTVANRIAHTNDTSTSVAFGVGVISLIADGNTRLSVIDSVTQISGGLNVTVGDSAGIATFAGNIDANADLNVAGVSTFTSDSIFLSKVGIGTTNPVRNLHIHEPGAGGNAYLHMTTDATGGTTEDGFSLYVQPDGSTWYRARESTGRHIWTTVNTETMRLTADGNLGIGTDDPTLPVNAGVTAKLSVGIVSTYNLYSENINVSGISTFDGNLNIDGDIILDTPHVLGFGPSNSKGYIYHSSSNLMITNVVGDVYITTSDDDKDIKIQTDNGSGGLANYFLADGSTGEAILYHYGTERIKTSSSGAIVTGVLTATSFSGDGSALTNIGGGTLISGITIKEEGSTVGVAGSIKTLDFVGDTVTATASGTTATITIAGAGSTDGWTSDAQYNLAAGAGAGANRAAAAEKNVFIGTSAGCKLNSGDANVFLGWNAGYYTATGDQNFYGGYATGVCNQSGDRNVAIGSRALRGSGTPANNTGGCNIALGRDAGLSVTSGADNIALGRVSLGGANVTGSHNIAFGFESGCAVTSGATQILIGKYAGKGTQTGQDNVYMGRYSGCATSTGSYNVAIGANTMIGSGTKTGNTALGRFAGCAITAAQYNTFLGYGAGHHTTTGCYNIAIGCAVCLSANNASTELAIGCGASRWICGDSSFNVTLAGIATATASGGIFEATKFCGDGSALTGISAGFDPDAQENLYAGTSAGCCSNTHACFNVAIGYTAGSKLGSAGAGYGQNNVFIGKCAGAIDTNGLCNTFIGGEAGKTNINGFYNTFLGYSSGSSNSSANGNVYVGFKAGSNANAYCNTFLGACAGKNATGACNVVIGQHVSLANNSGAYQLAIGSGDNNWIDGDANFNVGIGTNRHDTVVGSAVTAKLSVGIVSTYQLYSGSTTLNNLSVTGITTLRGHVNLGHGGDGDQINVNGEFISGLYPQSNNTWDLGSLPSSKWRNIHLGGTVFTDNISATGIVTAISFSGDGSNLVGVAKSTVLEDAGINTAGTTTLNHFVVTGISTFGNNIAVTGTASATDFNSTSDIRLKTNIKRIEDPLSKVVRIEGVTFDWKEWNRPALGVIADQVQEVIPELVQDTDPKTVNYNGLIGLLIEAVKEQQTQIDDLKSRLSKLE